MADVIELDPNGKPLACTGAVRDQDNPRAVTLVFNRRPTDLEFRFIDEAMKRTAQLSANLKK